MPFFKLLTNLPKTRVPSDFVTKIIPLLSETVKKPPERFICVVNSDCQISITGDAVTPGVVVTLESIGNLGLQENNVISEKLTDFIEKELKVPKERILFTFYDLKPQDVARGGVTMPFM